MNFIVKAADSKLFVFLSYALSPIAITSTYVLFVLLGAGVWAIPPAIICIGLAIFANYWIVSNGFEWERKSAIAWRFLPLTPIKESEIRENIKRESREFSDEWAFEIGSDECDKIINDLKKRIEFMMNTFGLLNEISLLIELNKAHEIAYSSYLKKIQMEDDKEYVEFIRKWGWQD